MTTPPDDGATVEPGSVGDARVAAAVDRLIDVDQVALHEQPDIYADIHSRLNAAMAEVRSD
jgi:hypothetical protein